MVTYFFKCESPSNIYYLYIIDVSKWKFEVIYELFNVHDNGFEENWNINDFEMLVGTR